jgi:hypothetical protein
MSEKELAQALLRNTHDLFDFKGKILSP